MPLLDLGTLKIGVSVDSASAKKGLNDIKDASKKAGESVKTDWSKVASKLNSIGSTMSKAITLPIVALATASVKLASDTQETMGKVDAVFGESSKAVNDWADNSIDKMGMASQTALDAAAKFGNMGTSMGQTTEQAANMSTNIVQLAGDMSSFHNISVERANTALAGIYTGETEALKSLGVVMTEANLEQFAMNEGITTSYKEMSQSEKVMLRYKYVMNSTKNVQGNFAKTGGDLANQSRSLKENLKELGSQFGQALLPIVTKVVNAINGLLKKFQSLTPAQKKTITTIALLVAAIGPLLLLISKFMMAYNALKASVVAANTSMNASLGVIGLVAIAVAGLITLFAALKTQQEEIAKAAEERVNKRMEETRQRVLELKEAQEETIEETVSLKDKLIELGETDPDIDITTNADAAQPAIDDFRDALGLLITDTGDLEENIENVNEALDNYVESLTAARLATTVDHILNLTKSYQDGLISAEEFNQYTNESIAGYQAYKTAVDGTTGAFTDMLTAFDGGELTLEETNALLYGANEIAQNGTPLADEIDSAAEGMQRLQDASDNGIISQAGFNVVAQETAGVLSTEMLTAVDDVTGAYDTYNEQVQEVLDIEAAQREDTQKDIEAIHLKQEAMIDFTGAFTEGKTAIEALEVVEKKYGTETAEAIKTSFEEKYGDFKVGYSRIGVVSAQWIADEEALVASLNEDTGAIALERTEKIKGLEEQLATDLGTITTGWTDDQIDEFAKFAEDSGFELDNGFIEMLKSINTFVEDSEDAFANGGEDAHEQFTEALNKITPFLDGLNTTTSGQGDTIGYDFASGTAKGIARGDYQAVNAAKKMVERAIAAAQKAGDIRSPSRKMKDLVGKPLAEGIGVGFDDEIRNVVKKVQLGIGNITSGGAATIRRQPTQNISTSNNTLTQNINFTSKPLSHYEQQLQVRRFSRELAGAMK